MASDRTPISSSAYPGDLKHDLLHAILSDTTPYPWEPDTEAADAFFARLDDVWLEDQSPEELEQIHAQGTTFFAQLDQLWGAEATSAMESIKVELVQHFGDRMPTPFLDSIVRQAQALITTQQPLADQLVQCVQGLLSSWATDDLMVLARPYAYAMRGNDSDSLEAALRSVRYAAWTELSGVEQARLSLAIARYTLSQLSPQDTP